jgi:hypothetical protein
VQRQSGAGARALHQRAVASALATLQVASNADRLALCRGVFDFANSAGSGDGIESMVLSCIVTSSRLGSSSLTRLGLNTWRRLGQPAHLGAGFTQTPVLDVSASLVSFLGRGDLNAFSASLGGVIPTANGGGVALGVGVIPGAAPQGGVPGLAPGVANSDQDRSCLTGFMAVGGAVGLVGGLFVGSATAGTGASDGKRDSTTVGTAALGLVAGISGGLAFGQAVCGNAAPTTPQSNTPAPSNDTGDTTTGPTQDDTNYNDGFAAGWASVTGSTVAPGATVSSSWMNGYADGAAAASLMPVVAPVASSSGTSQTDPVTTPDDPLQTVDMTTVNTDTTTTDPTPAPTSGGSDPTTDPTTGEPTVPDNDPTPSDGDGPPPTSAATPQPDGDGGDDGEGSKSYLHSVPTGPGVAGLFTALAGGKSFIVGGIGQAPGGAGSPGLGPDGRTPNDGDGGGSDDNQGHRIPLGANISIPTPRDPELDPHARAALAAAVARAMGG